MKPKPKQRGADYKRDPSRDPHLPHTTKFRRHDDLNFPSAALVVMKTRWPELVRTFQQWDEHTGMLEVYRLTRDAAKAANFPDSMAFLVRDYIIGKLNDQGIHVGPNRDKFKMKPQPYESRAQCLVNRLLEADFHSDSEKEVLDGRKSSASWPFNRPAKQIAQRASASYGRQRRKLNRPPWRDAHGVKPPKRPSHYSDYSQL